MDYQRILPCPELRNYISYFWVGTWDVNLPPNDIYYVVANSLTEISFAFEGNQREDDLLFTVVQGQTHRPQQFKVDGFYHVIGVCLHSFAIPKLFNISATELYMGFLTLETFLGLEGRELTEKMALAATTGKRIAILTDFFKSLVRKRQREDQLIAQAVQIIKDEGGSTRINELAQEFCLSEKQFKRRFKASTGFNPKLFNRIVRFESVIKTNPDWTNLTEAAYNNGYFDQSHLNHDFKTFTGFSPTDFYKLST
ncbi:transcriptional regulator, AraC family [Allomuricauda ruestringensis DSM 13258]|uniref:Transcriptional regulator, AraC family n=1 Tax=Allomuricauda ruestringensis (strain DSM 13258 / CIP 107369 / LMG 19739 / B1) TaxID=886377 RepID=G2PPW6_ALLRU|nr:AraC family transcriptional regulator [Allomuricauda ruestringensis]AEM71544.1 transcriptional regulator, AraC family [Allomuricauda ruestringensis DSM 13258]|tara:strand:+ start:1205 stop:1966 length:762 start_codon:yes stop_codon:yes gene_type:complete